MGLFDTILGAAFGGGNRQDALARIAGELLGSEGTGQGLAKLLQQFQSKGLGDAVGSWVGTGKNEPIAPADVETALGREQVEHFAQQSGMSAPDMSDTLAKLLPQLVDKLTPDGRIPAESDLQSTLASLLRNR